MPFEPPRTGARRDRALRQNFLQSESPKAARRASGRLGLRSARRPGRAAGAAEGVRRGAPAAPQLHHFRYYSVSCSAAVDSVFFERRPPLPALSASSGTSVAAPSDFLRPALRPDAASFVSEAFADFFLPAPADLARFAADSTASRSRGLSTSSMMASSALSPSRRPSLMMRV